jgi:transcriptional regulator with XRE-family HTH domain
MPDRIGPKNPVRVFLREWREHCGLTQVRLGGRIGAYGVDKGTISRWENSHRRPTDGVLAAFAEALGIHPVCLYRPPSSPPSLDEAAVVAGLSHRDIQRVIAFIEQLKRD